MAYIITVEKKVKGSTMSKREIVGACEVKDLNKKVEMIKRLYPDDKVSVFKEIKLKFGDKKWK